MNLSDDATFFLLRLVEQFPALWDMTLAEYADTTVKESIWERIAKEMNEEWPAYGPYDAISSECLLILRCYVAAKKFRSVHKYGKRRKDWNKGQTTAAAVPVAVPDGACSSSVTEPLLRPFADCCEAESVEGATSSYVEPPDAVDRDGRSREPDCGGTASAADATPGVRAVKIVSRVSAQIPSSEEITQRAQTRRDVLDAVASKSASKRKLELLNEGKDSTFFIVNKKMLNGLLSSAKCNKCDEGSIRLETTHCLGLAARMELFCDNCGIVNSAWSSPRCSGQQKNEPL
ncbi:hypothetical protein HPB51_001569 [Rhipicephalus microplus]|uniref:MADF domain-containing protein n=1 Tax=Rhipicephalus microplus TaxID=6941 RepID=A0A9J6EVT2_RHIMP|nr:hypothetical protein HPB51_001569 [Rhipicephalus microplus]